MQIITNNAGKELKKHGDNAFPFLVSYERLSGYETGSFLWHWHPEIELTYVKKGEMLYKVNQNTFHLKEGDRLVVLGDEEQGIAFIKAEIFEERMQKALNASQQQSNE